MAERMDGKQTKEEVLAQLDKLEAELIVAVEAMRGDPSAIGHDIEFRQASFRMEEAMMWIRRGIDRKFSVR